MATNFMTPGVYIEEKDAFMKGHAERVASNCAGFCWRYNLLKKMKSKISFLQVCFMISVK